jgi:cell division protein FtsB
MRKNQKSSSIFRRNIGGAVLALFFFVLLIASFFGEKGWIEIYRAQKQKEALLLEIESLKKDRDQLLRDIDKLKNDPQAVEEKARDKLWLMRSDEIVIIKK